MKLKKWILTGLFFAALVAVFLFCNQADFYLLFPLYTIAFGSYFLLNRKIEPQDFKFLLGAGVLIRLVSIFIFPNLSDDIYRFYWDGLLWSEGIHPFDFLPSELINQMDGNSAFYEIYPLLNSKDYFTIYPPVCQFFFYLVAKVSGSISVFSIVLKSLFCATEFLTVFGLVKILKKLDRPTHQSLWYFLNPLIIIELCGNLHFEVFMVCGLTWMVYALLVHRYAFAGIAYALAIMSKILPFMLGPYLLWYLWKRQKAVQFYVPAGFIVLLGFGSMLYSSNITHLLESINLYFQKFEFNAGIYYILREIGRPISGYNLIKYIGPFLGLIAMISILYQSWNESKNKNFKIVFLATAYLIFLLLSTTIHPWYLAVPLAFCVFERRIFFFTILWSFLAMLSYSAYDTVPVQEHLWALGLEYGFLFVSILIMQKSKISLANI